MSDRHEDFLGEPSVHFSRDSILGNKTDSIKPISRRDFLKVGGVVATSIALAKSPVGSVLARGLHPSPDRINPVDFGDKVHKYDTETESKMLEIWDKYAIMISSTKVFYFLGANSETIEKENLPWPTDAIKLVCETIEEMPIEYRSSRFNKANNPMILNLVRQKGASGPNVGGGTLEMQNMIRIYAPEDFNINYTFSDSDPMKSVYGNVGTHLKAAVVHEFTHNYSDFHPDILDKWKNDIGWTVNENEEWINSSPENLIAEAYANSKPAEDLAVSVGRWLVNPDSLSADRKDFFKKNKPYRFWPNIWRAIK